MAPATATPSNMLPNIPGRRMKRLLVVSPKSGNLTPNANPSKDSTRIKAVKTSRKASEDLKLACPSRVMPSQKAIAIGRDKKILALTLALTNSFGNIGDEWRLMPNRAPVGTVKSLGPHKLVGRDRFTLSFRTVNQAVFELRRN